MKKLLTSINYLRLKSNALKMYKIWWPLSICVFSVAVYFFLPEKPQIISENGLISQLNSIIGTLAGFYITSLAAVSTFQSTNLDEPIKGSGIKAPVYTEGTTRFILINRKVFYVICLVTVPFFLFLFLDLGLQQRLYTLQ